MVIGHLGKKALGWRQARNAKPLSKILSQNLLQGSSVYQLRRKVMKPIEERLRECREELWKVGACPDEDYLPGKALPPEVLLEYYESVLRFERMYQTAKKG